MLRLMCFLTVFLSLACASATKLYPGSKRPAEEIATLKMVTNGAITRINGRALEGRHFALLPGTYDVRFHIIVQGSEVHSVYQGRPVRWTFHCETKLALAADNRYEISKSKPRESMSRTGRLQTAGLGGGANVDIDLYLTSLDEQGNTRSQEMIECSDFVPEGGWDDEDA